MSYRQAVIDRRVYGADLGRTKSDLSFTPMTGRSRHVRSLALCPWHDEQTPSLMADHCKAMFECLSCGVKGYLVTPPPESNGHDDVLTLELDEDD